MNNITITLNDKKWLTKLDKMDVAALRQELAKQIGLTAENILRLAIIVSKLEEKGADLSDIRIGLLSHIRRVAHGELIPEAVVRFGGSPTLLNHISHLPLSDQQKLTEGKTVTLAVKDGQSTTSRKVDPLHLTREELNQVFDKDKGKIRKVSEQIPILEEKKKVAPKKAPVGNLQPDGDRKGIWFQQTFYPVSTVLETLALLGRSSDEDEYADKPISIRLTKEEHRQLKKVSADNNLTMAKIIRDALYGVGILGR